MCMQGSLEESVAAAAEEEEVVHGDRGGISWGNYQGWYKTKAINEIVLTITVPLHVKQNEAQQ